MKQISNVIPVNCFTLSYPGITNILKSEIQICQAFDPRDISDNVTPNYKDNIAIWDTGATNSVITQKVVDECQLKPIGISQVHHADGTSLQEVYLVNIQLPNRKIVFFNVRVTCANLVGSFDALIGMDIICRGDFAVSNYNNQTTMTFRIPSIGKIDFVESVDYSQRMVIGRNEPCPCGSRLKFKKCCGK